jgi:serine/threonine-protein kinase
MAEPFAASEPQFTLPLEAPAPDTTSTLVTEAGPHCGRFTLQRFHAKGGLGEVHVAVDAELGRDVALKRMQDRYTRDAAARHRFLNEAEITARLEHPGIVPIYGLVQDDQGHPCYAMRFIAGESLADALKKWHESEPDYSSLAFRQLLQRFISVCQTMGYAHSKRVLHRDLKPANVMLGPFGETLVVDWGLAKRVVGPPQTAPSEAEAALLTTVDFAQDANDDRMKTEVGQVLGTAGYMSPEQAAGQSDTVGLPSDIYSLGATLYELLTGEKPLSGLDTFTVLQRTQTGNIPPSRQVKPTVPGVLDAVCRKAMALRPEARYASATALAADLEHWLADEPIAAYTEPWTTRAWRWSRRHRTLITGLAAALVVGLVCAGVALVVLEGAYANEQSAKNDAMAQKIRADAERERAEKARDATHQAFDDLTNTEALAYLKTQPELRPEQKAFLERAAAYYRQVALEAGTDPTSRQRVALSHFRLGYLLEALGRLPEAQGPYRQAQELFEKLAADFPAVPEYRQTLARTYNNFALLLRDSGQLPAARQTLLQALEIQEKLVADFPAVVKFRQELAVSYHKLGTVQMNLGQHKAAEQSFGRALAMQEKLRTEFPDNPLYRQELGLSYNSLGILKYDMGQWRAAEAAYRQALAIQVKTVADFPAVADYRHDVVITNHNLGNVLMVMKQHSVAEQAFRQSLEDGEKLVSEFPTVPRYRQELGRGHSGLGILKYSQGQLSAAEPALRRALEIQERLAAEFPKVPGYRQDVAGTSVNLGNVLHAQGRSEDSLPFLAKAIALLETLLGQEPRLFTERVFLRNAHFSRARALEQLGRHPEAVKDWERAVEVNPEPRTNTFFRHLRAQSLARAGQHAKAVAEATALAAAKDVTGTMLYDFARICAMASVATKEAALQEQYAANAVSLLRQAVAQGYKHIERIKNNNDLKVLREREDYKKLLEELATKREKNATQGK